MRKLALTLLAIALVLLVLVARRSNAASFDQSKPCPPSGIVFVCPPATVGVPYSVQLQGVTGCDKYWFRIDSGALPPGLTMSRSGLVSGTATEAAVTTPWLSIHDLLPSEGGYDWCGYDNQSERQFQFSAFGTVPVPAPTPTLKWYWHLSSGSVLLHSERAITYSDGTTGLGRMLRWELAHKDQIRASGHVLLEHLQATG
jgi:hypothetical protein